MCHTKSEKVTTPVTKDWQKFFPRKEITVKNTSEKVVCRFCKKTNHKSAYCRSKRNTSFHNTCKAHGQPQRTLSIPKSQLKAENPQKTRVRCDWCSRVGHSENECRCKRRYFVKYDWVKSPTLPKNKQVVPYTSTQITKSAKTSIPVVKTNKIYDFQIPSVFKYIFFISQLLVFTKCFDMIYEFYSKIHKIIIEVKNKSNNKEAKKKMYIKLPFPNAKRGKILVLIDENEKASFLVNRALKNNVKIRTKEKCKIKLASEGIGETLGSIRSSLKGKVKLNWNIIDGLNNIPADGIIGRDILGSHAIIDSVTNTFKFLDNNRKLVSQFPLIYPFSSNKEGTESPRTSSRQIQNRSHKLSETRFSSLKKMFTVDNALSLISNMFSKKYKRDKDDSVHRSHILLVKNLRSSVNNDDQKLRSVNQARGRCPWVHRA